MPRFFGQADGIIFKQAVRLDLCGVALDFIPCKLCKVLHKANTGYTVLAVAAAREHLVYVDERALAEY